MATAWGEWWSGSSALFGQEFVCTAGAIHVGVFVVGLAAVPRNVAMRRFQSKEARQDCASHASLKLCLIYSQAPPPITPSGQSGTPLSPPVLLDVLEDSLGDGSQI